LIDVCSALRFLADERNKPEYLTTAWFIETFVHWFSLMTSMHIVMALSKLKPEVYKKSIIFLNNFIEMMTHLEVGLIDLGNPLKVVLYYQLHQY